MAILAVENKQFQRKNITCNHIELYHDKNILFYVDLQIICSIQIDMRPRGQKNNVLVSELRIQGILK